MTMSSNQAGSGRRTTGAGFTLIELMMVLAIGVILAAIAIPNLRTSDRMRVAAAAREIQQELHAARL
ncbi:MAG TPA: prepilin-type N-terminal cleavage/methylation domain-containing protein, partial [Vicinamibacterales bacterium]|nr:prepilin-type N-terminal cleavage/methylation domain-containing protein [Vicinamibacterales bacterium]